MTRLAVALFFLAVLASPLIAQGQPAGKVYRIGLLTTYYRADDTGPVAFRQELRKLGWIEGQNIVIEVRSAEGKAERLPELAADLVRLKVDVIMAMGDLAAVPASQATRTIPIVAGSADPVGIGLVTNLARPEGNVTGLHIQAAETAGKRLQLLKEVVPTVSRRLPRWSCQSPAGGEGLSDWVSRRHPAHREGRLAHLGVFAQRLRELGWVEGKSSEIERLYSEGRHEWYPDLVAELVSPGKTSRHQPVRPRR